MPPMTAYTLCAGGPARQPYIYIDVGRNITYIHPDKSQPNSYWFVFLEANNPRVKVKEWIWPGDQHAAVPPGIDTYMNDPKYIFAVITHTLWTPQTPQGPLYDFLAKYGAGRELQRLEQISAVGPAFSCGGYGNVSYVLTSTAGPRVHGQPPPPSYEIGGTPDGNLPALLLLSLMPQANGGPPYSIMDANTWTSPPTK
jgi:hypothetical protein